MSKVEVLSFEKTSRGEQTHLYKITNTIGASVTLCDFGATVMSVNVYDKFNKLRDVVLGYSHIKDYETGGTYFGATVGRCCGRIANGRFTLNGKEYNLTVNDSPNHLHGGNHSFSRRIWDTEIIENGVLFSLISRDKEEGYPGNMIATVLYTFDDENSLNIRYSAICDKDTVCNLTNHSYFNLNGHDSGSVIQDDHWLKINANSYVPINKLMIPTGELRHVKGNSFDFTEKRPIGSAFTDENDQVKIAKGIDHMFVINRNTDQKILAAEAESTSSGIKLRCYTTQKGVHIYTANYVNVSSKSGKSFACYAEHSAFCMETQGFPDAVNHELFPSTVLKANTLYRQETSFVFSN